MNPIRKLLSASCLMLAIAGGLAATSLVLSGCTGNQQAKAFGGKVEITKPQPHWELINITWKQENLWVLWYDPKTDICHFKEDSSFGIIEGEVVIKECSLSQLSTQAR